MLDASTLMRLQAEQFRHDQRNHSDIICLAKVDRLKHYGLHYAKYVGRLFRLNEAITVQRTVTDTALVCLSAANTLHQRIDQHDYKSQVLDRSELLARFADASGRFADACEKIDHLENFLDQAKTANIDVMDWVVQQAAVLQLDLVSVIGTRRRELADRAFFIKD